MESLSNRDYYLSRAADARARAEAARHPRIYAIHLELADRYEELAELVTETPRLKIAD